MSYTAQVQLIKSQSERWHSPKKAKQHLAYRLKDSPTIVIPCASSNSHPGELQYKLDLLRTHPLLQGPELSKAAVQLDKWTLSEPVLQALRQLPHGQGRFDLSTCSWPGLCTQEEYKTLAGVYNI